MQTGVEFLAALLTVDGEWEMGQVLLEIVLPILVLVVTPQLLCAGAYNYLNLKKRVKYLEDQMVSLTGKRLPSPGSLEFEPEKKGECDGLCSHMNFWCPGKKRYWRLQMRIHILEQALAKITKERSCSCHCETV